MSDSPWVGHCALPTEHPICSSVSQDLELNRGYRDKSFPPAQWPELSTQVEIRLSISGHCNLTNRPDGCSGRRQGRICREEVPGEIASMAVGHMAAQSLGSYELLFASRAAPWGSPYGPLAHSCVAIKPHFLEIFFSLALSLYYQEDPSRIPVNLC